MENSTVLMLQVVTILWLVWMGLLISSTLKKIEEFLKSLEED